MFQQIAVSKSRMMRIAGKPLPIDLLPLVALGALLVSAAAGFLIRSPRPRFLPRLSETSALIAIAVAVISAVMLVLRGRIGGRLFGLHGAGLSIETLDKDFAGLELIMTAPGVVAGRIVLQYYGSTVSPKLIGTGNKLFHNVIGGLGVLGAMADRCAPVLLAIDP